MTNKRNIPVRASDDTLRGKYANMMRVSHTPEEFVLDFMNVLPTDAMLTSRIITSPGHMKRIIEALKDNMGKFESQFGVIRAAKEPSEPTLEGIGFRHSSNGEDK